MQKPKYWRDEVCFGLVGRQTARSCWNGVRCEDVEGGLNEKIHRNGHPSQPGCMHQQATMIIWNNNFNAKNEKPQNKHIWIFIHSFTYFFGCRNYFYLFSILSSINKIQNWRYSVHYNNNARLTKTWNQVSWNWFHPSKYRMQPHTIVRSIVVCCVRMVLTYHITLDFEFDYCIFLSICCIILYIRHVSI